MTQPMQVRRYASVLTLGLMSALWGLAPAQSEALPLENQFRADASVHVFESQLYLYVANDRGNAGRYWNSRDWRVLSSKDGADWTDHGAVFDLKGQGLVFYHRNAVPGGGAYKRSIVSQAFNYIADASIRPLIPRVATPARQ